MRRPGTIMIAQTFHPVKGLFETCAALDRVGRQCYPEPGGGG